MSGAVEVAPTWHERVAQLRREFATSVHPPYRERLGALDALSKRLMTSAPDDELRRVPGIAFLAAFLGSKNLSDLVAREIPNPAALDAFVPVGGRKSLRLAPRGVVCPWIAGNVPLLGMFSWAVSALAGNINLIRLSSRQDDFVTPLLQMLAATGPAGARLAAGTVVVRFERDDEVAQRRMSELADVRIAWGSEEAVEAIAAFPARWDAETLVFGPRVSLAVIDPALATGGTIRRLVTDIIYFDQLACSSPQRVFVKGHSGDSAVVDFIDKFCETLDQESRSLPRGPVGFAETYRIELDRARVLLEDGQVRAGLGTSWTVAVNRRPVTTLMCMNRFVEIVPFAEIDDVLGWIPDQAQTAVTLLGGADLGPFSEGAALRGVCRFPRPGEGNGFESPWDGEPLVSRLTRWIVRTEPREDQ